MPHSSRIFIADSDADLAHAIGSTLSSAGYAVDTAAGASEAVDRIHRYPFDVILAASHMPGGEPLELLEQARRLQPASPVIVLASESNAGHVIQSIRADAFCYFSKPFTLSAVADMTQKAAHSTGWAADIDLLSATSGWIALRLRCKLDTADRLMQFMREASCDLPIDERERVAGAFRELLLNAIEHGGRSDPGNYVYVTHVRTARAVFYYVRDPGSGFSMDALPHAAISNPPEEPAGHVEIRDRMGIRPGGFGILLTRHLVDEVVYNEKGNEVLLVQYLGEHS
ncbi:MAG: ATP-binding protein [Bryobacteraceae bacterium]